MTDSERFMLGILLFVAAGIGMGLGTLIFGKLIRPSNPGGMKDEIYECGEPTIGSAWVQFDLRFYVVAILFLVFDVEIALLYPWAVTFKSYILNGSGFLVFTEMMFFFGLIIIGFCYLWKFGYLDWVRSGSIPHTDKRG
ncbi:MAG: NADH-quinone oxidoreductase subunit A [Desulfobacteraceae bacterium]|nr:MAG: NADH-quinone oxidoreductase subunit A [Desulfobacteraceae bacterium]